MITQFEAFALACMGEEVLVQLRPEDDEGIVCTVGRIEGITVFDCGNGEAIVAENGSRVIINPECWIFTL